MKGQGFVAASRPRRGPSFSVMDSSFNSRQNNSDLFILLGHDQNTAGIRHTFSIMASHAKAFQIPVHAQRSVVVTGRNALLHCPYRS